MYQKHNPHIVINFGNEGKDGVHAEKTDHCGADSHPRIRHGPTRLSKSSGKCY